MSTEKPKIAGLPNRPYYLSNDLTPRVIPNIQKSEGDPCTTNDFGISQSDILYNIKQESLGWLCIRSMGTLICYLNSVSYCFIFDQFKYNMHTGTAKLD